MKKADRATKRSLPSPGILVARLCSRRGLLLTTALQAVAAAAVIGAPVLARPAAAQPAPTAAPTGGQVVAGQASIAQTVAQTTVSQASQRAAVNWQSFDVGSAHTVQFQQPSASAVTLNRVVGPNPSEIAGRIQANGQVVLVNQAGVLFHKGAQVDTAGLVVSAAGISNSNFMAGRMVFDQAPNPGAKVENRGTITIRERGLAALVAPQVANSGVIRANMGTVILGGAEAHTLDLYGDGMVSINVTRQVRTAPDGTKALVTNSGVVSAAGGTVVLTAEAVDGVVQTLVNSGGTIAADTMGTQTGRVAISGRGGDVVVAGVVTAEGRAPRQVGGTVAVNTTGGVAVASGARISASGGAGGGTVALGTTLARAKGGSAVTGQATAKSVTVAKGATVAADAKVKGSGGNVTLLSTASTKMAGTITAKGGKRGGDGGFVEVSGETGFSLTGSVDVSAPAGKLGTILLDPLNLTIGVEGADNGTVGVGDPQIGYDTQPAGLGLTDSFITPASFTGLLGNIRLQAARDLTVAAPVVLPLIGQTLTLEAGRNLTVQAGAPITAMGNIALLAASPGAAGSVLYPTGYDPAGALTINASVFATGGTLALSAGTGGITLAAPVLGSVVDLTTTGGVTQTAGFLNAITLVSSGGVGGAVSLGLGNTISNLGASAGAPFSAVGQSFNLTNVVPLTVNGVTADTVALTAPSITIPGTVVGTNSVTLNATAGGISEIGVGAITTALLTGSATDAVALDGAGNAVDALGVNALLPFDATGQSFSLATANALMVNGVKANTVALTAPGIVIPGMVVGTNSVTLNATAGGISEIGTGAITTALLTGSATDAVALDGAGNAIDALGASALLPFDATGQSFSLATANALAVNGVKADTVALTAPSITIPGTIVGTTSVALNATAGGISETGTGAIITALLAGGAKGVVALNNAGNEIDALGVSALAPFDATGQAFSLWTKNALTVNGVTADMAFLGAPSITIPGTVVGTTSVTLNAITGGISETGTGAITTASLAGLANDAVALDGAGNAIDALGNSLVMPFVAFGKPFSLTSANALTVNWVMADSVSLTAPSIAIPGIIAGTTSVTLNATTGGISEAGTGAITTALLTGSAKGAVALNGVGNAIDALGVDALTPFDATGQNFSLATANVLTVNGVTADTVALTAPGITIPGTIVGTTSVALNATAGGISETGTGAITTALLTGGAAGAVVLDGAGNAIDALGASALLPFNAIGQSFSLTTANALTVNGVVADTVALTAPGITIPGTIAGPLSVALNATAGGISEIGTGAITTGLLTGSAKDAVALDGAGNIISTLGASALAPFDATGKAFSLATMSPLIINGVMADTVALTAPSLFILGTIVGTSSVALNATAGWISEIGVGAITTALLTGSATGPVMLISPTNTIDALGASALLPFDAIGQSFSLATANALTVNGVVADTVALTAPGITIPGTIVGTTSVALNATAGGISEIGTGAITTALLTGSAKDTVALDGAGNAIDALGIGALLPFDATGKAFSLATANALTVNGVVADTVALTAPGIVIPGTIVGSTSVALNATVGGISETGAGAITTALLTGSAKGAVALDGVTNAIDALGASVLAPFDATGQAFSLATANALTVNGVTADTVALTAPGITIPGTIAGPTSVTLNATTGGISETGAGAITTALLAGSAKGTVALSGVNNAIDTVAAFAVTGIGNSFTLVDTGDLTVSGALVAPQDIVLTTVGGGKITATGSIGADNLLSVTSGTGGIALNGGAVLTGATIDLIGGGGPITLAAASTLGQPSAVIDLSASNGINEDAAAQIIAGTLTSTTGIGGPVSLAGIGNAIGTLAAFAVSGIGNSFNLTNIVDLSVTGPVTAPQDVSLHLSGIGTISTSGSLGAGGTLSLSTTFGGIALDNGAILTAPTIALSAISGGIALNGTASVGSLSTSLLDLSALGGSVTEASTAVISADTLVSSFGVGTGMSLVGTANRIGTIGSVTVVGGAFSLVDNTVATLTVTGPLTANGITLDTSGATAGNGAIDVAGAIDAGAGPALFNANDAILLGANVNAGTIDLRNASPSALGYGVTQTAGSLTASVLRSGANARGNVHLLSATNAIAELRDFSVLGGAFILNDTGSLLVSGPVSVGTHLLAINAGTVDVAGNLTSNQRILLTGSALAIESKSVVNAPTISLQGDAISVAAAGTLTFNGTPGTIEVAPLNAGPITLTDAPGSSLSLDQLAKYGEGLLRIGAVTNLGGTLVTTANAIAVTGTYNRVGKTLELDSTGTISGGGALINVATLTGTAAAVDLTGANLVEVLGTFDVSAGGGFTLWNADALGVLGPVSGDNVTIQAATLDVIGTVTAKTGGATLIATTGTLGQAGTVNAVTLASLTAATDLTHSGTTTVSGLGAIASLLAQTGTLTQTGTVSAASGGIVETATLGNIVHNGLSTAGSGGAALWAGGSITQSGGTIESTDGSVSLTAGVSITQIAGTIQATGTLPGTQVTLAANGTGLFDGIAAAGLIQANNMNGAVGLTAAQGIGLFGTVLAAGAGGAVSANAQGMLTQAGTVGATNAASLTAGTDLMQLSTVSAATITETAGGNLMHTGLSDATDTATLMANGGTLLQSGTVKGTTAASLTASTDLTQLGTVAAATITETAGGNLTHIGLSDATDTATLMANGGTLLQSGTVKGTTAASLIAATDLTQSGTVTAAMVTESAGTNLTHTGLSDATDTVMLMANGGTLFQSGTVNGTTAASLTAATDLTQSGTVTAGAITEIALGGALLHTGLSSAGAGGAFLSGGTVTQNGGTIEATDGNIFLTAGTSIAQNAGTIQAIGTLAGTQINLIANGAGTADGVTINGLVQATNPGGMVAAIGQTVTLTSAGTVDAKGSAGLTAQTTLTQDGSVIAGSISEMALGGDILHSGFSSAETGDLVLQAGGLITQSVGTIVNAGTMQARAGDVALTAGTTITQTAGTIQANSDNHKVDLTAVQSITLNDIVQATGAGGTVTAFAQNGTLTNAGTTTAGKAVSMTAQTDLLQSGSVVVTEDNGAVDLTATTGTLTQSGTVLATQIGSNITLAAGPRLTNTGLVAAGGTASLSGGLVEQFGAVSGGFSVVENAGGDITHTGTSAAGVGGATLTAGGTIALNGVTTLVEATDGDVILTAGISIAQNGGTIRTIGTLPTAIQLASNGTLATDGITQQAGALIHASDTLGTVALSSKGTIALAGTVKATDAGVGMVLADAQGFTLVNSGTVLAGKLAGLTAQTTLTNTGLISAGGTASLGAGTIEQSGTVFGDVTVFETAGTLIHHTGTSSAGMGGATLTAGGTITLDGASTLVDATDGDVVLTAGTSIAQNGGTIRTIGTLPTAIHLTSNGTLATDGITQQAGALIQASDTLGTVTLVSKGMIDLTGTVRAADAGVGTVIADAQGFTLVNSGTMTAGKLVRLTAHTDLTQAGTVAAAGIEEAAGGNILHSGFTDAGADGATLTAGGSITQSVGTIANGGTIQSTDGDVSLTAGTSIAQNAGTIQTIGTLPTTISLTANGTLATDGITQQAGALIRASDTLGMVTLVSKGTIDLAGTVRAADAGVGTVIADAQGFTLVNSGTMTAGKLVRLTAHTDLTQAGTVAAAGVEEAADGNILHSGFSDAGADGATLTAGGSITQTIGTIANGGTIQSTDGDVSLTADSIAQNGGTIQAIGTASATHVTLVANGFDGIFAAGLIRANNPGGLVGLTAMEGMRLDGTVEAAGTDGTILATVKNGSLYSGPGYHNVVWSPVESGALTNTGTMSAGGGVFLDASKGNLNQFGTVTGAVVSQTAGIALTQSGTSTASSGAATLTVGGGTLAITETGIVAASGAAMLEATGGNLVYVNLITGGDLIQRGSVTGASVSQTASRSLTQTGVSTAMTGDATLAATTVDQGGIVNAIVGNASLTANGGTLSQSGAVSAGGLASLAATGGNLSQSGSVSGAVVSQTASAGLTQSGTSTASSGAATLTVGGGTLAITGTGAVVASGAATLAANGGNLSQSGSVTGATVSQTASNSLAQTGVSTATSGNVTLAATTVDLSGTVKAGAGDAIVAANGGALSQSGSVSAYGTATLTATGGALSQSGSVTGAVVTQSATNGLAHSGTTTAASGSATLTTEAGTLTQNGTVSGLNVTVSSGGAVISGGTYANIGSSGADPRYRATIEHFPAENGPGLSITGNTVTLTSQVLPAAGVTNPDLTVRVTGGGHATFGAGGAPFYTPATSLWLRLLGRATVLGGINVAGLHVYYDQPTESSIRLVGVVGGRTGSDAAAASFIQPLPKNNYQLNGCPIQSLNCIQFTSLTVPVTNPLKDVEIGRIQLPSEIEIMLPDVAERDY